MEVLEPLAVTRETPHHDAAVLSCQVILKGKRGFKASWDSKACSQVSVSGRLECSQLDSKT